MDISVQIHLDGEWHDAAVVELREPDRGHRGESSTSYEVDYWTTWAVSPGDMEPIDRRALSVRYPAGVAHFNEKTWPSWLLDLLPQGAARQRIARTEGLRADDPAVEVRLLLRAAGAPIGNLRIREAWEAEQDRLDKEECRGLTDNDIAGKTDDLLDIVDRFAHLASGSSGVQGEWPKALMTRSGKDGLWYPDPFVETQDGTEHVILKLLKSTSDTDRLILEAEAPYLELARWFGLNCAAPLRYHDNVLIMPRFDRELRDGRVYLHGQESLTSALGVSEFGAPIRHEDALEVIAEVSDEPAADRLEYLTRDVLNLAAGNPDNHGRNTALQKRAEGGVRLSPLFDFAPMRLSDAGIARQSRWACLDGDDRRGDWRLVCEAVAGDGLSADAVRKHLVGLLPKLRTLPTQALTLGVPERVVERCIQPATIIERIEAMEDPACQP